MLVQSCKAATKQYIVRKSSLGICSQTMRVAYISSNAKSCLYNNLRRSALGITPAFGKFRVFTAAVDESDVIELDIKVEGMMCGGCTSRVQEALQKYPKAKSVKVSLENKLASVEVSASNQLDAVTVMPDLVKIVRDLGFEAEPHIDYQY